MAPVTLENPRIGANAPEAPGRVPWRPGLAEVIVESGVPNGEPRSSTPVPPFAVQLDEGVKLKTPTAGHVIIKADTAQTNASLDGP